MDRIYPDSKVEIHGFLARHYDTIMGLMSFGMYRFFIRDAISRMNIMPGDKILDMGAGTGTNSCYMLAYLSGSGKITGIDISDDMIEQFKKKCSTYPGVDILKMRADKELPFASEFDKVFISFVLHGLPQHARQVVIENAFKALRDRGEFFILDYNEFSLEDKAFYERVAFRMLECPYAFDFIKRDWKSILSDKGFGDFREHLFFRGYVRLLRARKLSRGTKP